MSNLRVATIETENETTDLTLTTGNTSGPEIIIAAGNNDINLTGDFIVSGNVSSTNIPAGTIITETSTSSLTNKTLTDPVINLGSDATGDLYYRAADGSFERLPIGANDEVLTVSSNLPSWAAAAAGSSISVCKAYGTSTSSISNAITDVTWGTPSISTSDISVLAEDITINTTGTYAFDVTVRTDSNNRTELFIRTYINDVEQTNDIVSDYVSRDIDQNTGAVNLNTVFELSATDVIRFEAEGDCDGTCVLMTAGTILRVMKIA